MTNDAHIATLRQMHESLSCLVRGHSPTSEQRALRQDLDALDAAIRALSADRGEAVAWRYRDASQFGDTEWRYLDLRPLNTYAEVEALYTTPPSPAESATPSGVSDALLGKLRCIGTLLQQLNAQTAAQAVHEAIAALEAAQPQPGRVEGMEVDHG